MRFVLTVSWLIGLHGATSGAQKCAAPPVQLLLREVCVAPGSLSRGVAVAIGTPPQRVALLPSLQLDNTFIPRYSNSCVAGTGSPSDNNTATSILPHGFDAEGAGEISCAQLYGGSFDHSLSSTFRDGGTNDQIREDWFRRQKYADWHFVTEHFMFADYLETYVQRNGMLPEKRNMTSSFILPEKGGTFGNLGASALGLTPNSTLLKALYDDGIVPSQSWSLTNRSLCLGCADDAAHMGDFRTFKPADRNQQDGLPCVLQAKVTALKYHSDERAEGASIIQGPFTTCIDPGVTFVVLPAEADQNYLSALGRRVKSAFDDRVVIQGSKNANGVLAFVIEGGLEVNVTLTDTGSSGAEDPGNWILPIGKGGWGAYGEHVPVLGKPFLEQVVLRWDANAQEYGIANANPLSNQIENLTPLGCHDFPVMHRAVHTTPGLGLIVGSLLGGFFGGLMFAMAGCFFFQRGRKGVKSKYERMRGSDAIPLRGISADGRSLRLREAQPTPGFWDTLRLHFGVPEPHMAADAQVYEAPEEGTAQAWRRTRLGFEDPVSNQP